MGAFDYQNGEYRYQTGQGPPPLSASVFEQLGYQNAEWEDRRRRTAGQSSGGGTPMGPLEMSVAWGLVGAIVGGVIAIAYVSNRHWSDFKMAWVVGSGMAGGAAAAITALWAIIGSFLLVVAVVVLLLRILAYSICLAAIVAALSGITWGLLTLTCERAQVCKFYFMFPKFPHQ